MQPLKEFPLKKFTPEGIVIVCKAVQPWKVFPKLPETFPSVTVDRRVLSRNALEPIAVKLVGELKEEMAVP